MSQQAKDESKQQGAPNMGLFGGPGPVLGGSAGGQDYSLASMLNRATQKQAGERDAAAAAERRGKELKGSFSSGTQDLLEGSGLLPGQNRGWQPDTPPLKSAPAAAPIQEHESEGPELHPAMSEGARNLLEGSGLLPERKDRA